MCDKTAWLLIYIIMSCGVGPIIDIQL